MRKRKILCDVGNVSVMYQLIDIDKAAEHVKNIIDTNRCAVCDKQNGKRMRYTCGHTSCDDCVPPTESCPFCLTPQDSSTFAAPSIDKPHTQRCQSANNLLNAFQSKFSVDVYRRHRLSEQLKLEKELFPQCIQAPAKYCNKRKSLKSFIENKENIKTVFAGEIVSSLIKMENSNANVREWLGKCVKRKPLGDLNHSRTLNTVRKQPPKVINTQNIDRSNRKRTYTEIWMDENQTIVKKQVAATKKNKENTIEKLQIKTDSSTYLQKIKNKDDSGISLDDDRVIIIDDSQTVEVDKDMNAWLAVLEAEKYALQASATLATESQLSHEIPQPIRPLKVPFYVKGPLCNNCKHSNDDNAVNIDVESEDQSKISITVENKSFTAIINVSRAERTNIKNTEQSVVVQTNNCLENLVDQGFVDEKYISYEKKAVSPIPCSSKSQDLFLDDANNFDFMNKCVKNVIIADSDSDEDVHSTSLLVTADVHRSYEEILVLDDVEDIQEHSKRPRRAARGHTPTSTDSSDKENYDPNRIKRSFSSKKKPVKK